jgi:outer membrane putative beta-barrel porin/alpha-amylase
MIRVLILGTFVAFLSVTVCAQCPADDQINADRPGIADGSNVVGAKMFQIESGAHFEFRRDGDTREHTFFVPTLLRFGIGSSWEARIESSTVTRDATFDSGNTTDETSGLAPASLGFKYHIHNWKCKHQISLGAIVRVFPAWGTNEFRPQHPTGDVRLAADWKLTPKKFSLNPNIGIARYEDDQGRLFTTALYAVTLSYQSTEHLNPFIDIGTQSSEASHGRSSAILDGGVAYTWKNLAVDATIATRVHGITGPYCSLEFGVSWRSKLFH